MKSVKERGCKWRSDGKRTNKAFPFKLLYCSACLEQQNEAIMSLLLAVGSILFDIENYIITQTN